MEETRQSFRMISPQDGNCGNWCELGREERRFAIMGSGKRRVVNDWLWNFRGENGEEGRKCKISAILRLQEKSQIFRGVPVIPQKEQGSELELRESKDSETNHFAVMNVANLLSFPSKVNQSICC